jgi:ribonuclease R
LVKVKLLQHLADKLGMQLDGVVTGVETFGLYVAGSELPAEGLVHISSLADDYYRYDRRSHTLTGFRGGNSYRLGDSVRVEVAAVDVERRELDFRIVQHGAGPPRDRKKGGRTKKPTRGQGPRARGKERRRKPKKGRS